VHRRGHVGVGIEESELRNSRFLIAILVAIAVLGAALWGLDFRASTSETHSGFQLSTATGGRNAEESVPSVQNLALYVEWAGEPDLAASLRHDLVTGLPAELGLASVEAVDALADPMERAVLMVEVREASVAWAPVYSRASLAVDVAYASDGATAWRGDEVKIIVMPPSPPAPIVRSQGTITVEDSTRGLVSRPAYYPHLRGQIASAVSKCLRPVLSPTKAGQASAQ